MYTRNMYTKNPKHIHIWEKPNLDLHLKYSKNKIY